MKKFGSWLAGMLFYGNLYIACCAVALVWVTYLQLGHRPAIDHLTGFVFFGTWLNYTLQRLLSVRKVEEDIKTPLMAWISNNQIAQISVMAVSGAGVVYNLLFIWQGHLIILAVIGILALAYSIPVRLLRGKVFRMRELGIAKIFLVSIVWGAVAAILPASYLLTHWWTGEVWLIFLERALLVFALILPFDIRDMEIDRAYQMKTIPITLGISGTIRLGAVLLALMTLAEVARVLFTASSDEVPVAVGFAVVSAMGTGLLAMSAKKRPGYFYYGLVDGVMLVSLGVVWCLHLWY